MNRATAKAIWTPIKFLILAGLVLWVGYKDWDTGAELLDAQPLGIDFLPLWTAARALLDHGANVYDFQAITERQHWLVPLRFGLRPFVYPPSALPWFLPFGLLSFPTANLLWTLGGALACLAASILAPARRRYAAAAFVVLAPAFSLGLIVGQTTFLIATLLVLAVCRLETRPYLAGALLGLAATIKPTALVLAPLCLVAGRHYRALAGAMVAGAAVGLLAVAAFGLQAWFDWLAALPRFNDDVLARPGLLRNMLTPTSAALRLGLDGAPLLAVRIIAAAVAATLAALVFRRTGDWRPRLIVMAGGALLISPYSMTYESLLLAPAVAAILVASQRGTGVPGLVLYGALAAAGMTYTGPYGLAAVVILTGLGAAWLGARPAQDAFNSLRGTAAR